MARSRINIFKLGILFLFVLFTQSACFKNSSPEDCTTYDYYDCNTVEPINQNIELSFSINKYIKKIPYVVYEGYVDTGKELFRDTATQSSVSFVGNFDVYYSVKAEYIIDGKKIFAIDGGKMKKTETVKCDSVCWDVKGTNFDLNLR